jgi:tripartite ATP-independent transporter DctM subunit
VATLILLGSFVVLLILRVPVALCLVASAILTGMYLDVPLEVIGQSMLNGLNSFSLMAIPLFILAGEIMGEGGISNRLIDLSNLLVGRFRGGFAMVNVVACMFFGGITGSAVADASTIGSVMIPMMTKKGYDKDFSVGVTCTASIQGVLVPPSHNIILYSLAAGGVSISALFMAGIVPGVVLGLGLMFVSYIIAVRRGYSKGEQVPRSQWIKILAHGALSFTTALIIIGGVVGGIFTANESAAIAVVYAVILVFFIFRDIPLRRLQNIFIDTVKKMSAVLFLISASAAFSWSLNYLQIPEQVMQGMTSISSNKYVILILINVILLVLGCIMDMAPLILIATPVLLPVAVQMGMSPVQFGIMLMLNLGIGLLTPPVGSALFVGCAIGNISMEKATKAMLPFLSVMLIILIVITFIPAFTLTLPRLLGQ